MTEVTKPQLNFLARRVIFQQVKQLASDGTGVLSMEPEEVEAVRLAELDVEKARAFMEEHVVYSHVLKQLAAEFPDLNLLDLKREARRRIKEPAVWAAALEECKVYLRLLGAS